MESSSREENSLIYYLKKTNKKKKPTLFLEWPKSLKSIFFYEQLLSRLFKTFPSCLVS